MKRFSLFLLLSGSLVFFCGASADPTWTNIFGPETFVRLPGKPRPVDRSFTVSSPVGECTMQVDNGPGSSSSPVSSAVVSLNGRLILGPDAFKPTARRIEVPVSIATENRLSVEVRGTPGSEMAVAVWCEEQGTNPDQPAITNLSAPGRVAFGSALIVDFDYSDRNGDIVALEQIRSDNRMNVPAGLIGIRGSAGRATVTIDHHDLMFGSNQLTLRLRDQAGNLSEPVSFSTDLVGLGSGGTAPVLDDFYPVTNLWTRPPDVTYSGNGRGVRATLTPPFMLSWSDPDGDIERIRLRIVSPAGQESVSELAAASLGIKGSSGNTQRAPMVLDARSMLGTYRLEATLIDLNGNQSASRVGALNVVSTGGATPVTIEAHSPTIGSAGTRVTLTGTGFDAEHPEWNRVTLSQIPAEVLEVTDASVTVLVPSDAGTGKFTVSNRLGTAVDHELFVVPVAVTLDPQTADVVVGGSREFRPSVVSSFSTRVLWSVNDIEGGNDAVGTITTDGVYMAPADPPAGGEVLIRATLASDSSVAAVAPVRVLPPPVVPGKTKILASVGGDVPSRQGTARITIPAGALSEDTEITIAELHGSERPTAESGRRILSALRFGPAGISFNKPARVTFPLTRFRTPGTRLNLSFLDTASGRFLRDEGLSATVLDNGSQAEALLSHFSVVVLDEPLPTGASALAPAISEVSPPFAQEGMRVPVRLRGSNLTGAIRLDILDQNGNPAAAVTAGTLYANGSEAGVLLQIGTDPALGENENRPYTLRVTGDFGQTAEASFAVVGLDELVVDGGSIRLPSFPGAESTRRFSEVRIGAAAEVYSPNPLVGIEATGPVTIEGTLSADGADGADGFGRIPGFKPDGSKGGAGGMGRNDSGCFLGVDDGFDCAETENWGEDADACVGDNANNPRRIIDCLRLGAGTRIFGLGGRPGQNDNFDLLDVFGTIIEALSCVASAGVVCAIETTVGLIELIDAAVSDGTTVGGNGFSALPGYGGGGAGGGGRVDGIPGGGGGAGGEPGRSIRITTADRVRVDAAVTARGGQGGNGGRIELQACSGLTDVSQLAACYAQGGMLRAFSLPDPLQIRGLTLDQLETLFVNSGGGGGGGAGGSLLVAAAGGIDKGSEAQFSARSGDGGIGGMTIIDARNSNAMSFSFRSAIGRPGAGGRLQLSDGSDDLGRPVFDPDALANGVLDRTLVRGVRAWADFDPHPVPGNFPPREAIPLVFTVTCEDQGQASPPPVTVQRSSNLLAETNLVLCPGFNTVAVETPGVTMPELLRKRILVLAVDSDADGLGDRDEADLGTDPDRPDTDGDGLSDGQEVVRGSNPLVADTDGDGLTDAEEVAHGTEPTRLDTDGDGSADPTEIVLGSSPTSADSRPTALPEGSFLVGSDGALAVLDPTQGLLGPLGRANGGLGFGLAYDDRAKLFIGAFDRLLTVDPLSADPSGDLAVTEVGSFGAPDGVPVHSIQFTYNPADRRFYGIELGPSPSFDPTGQLLGMAPDTGAAVRVGAPLAQALHALAFQTDGRLFASSEGDALSDRLVELDPDTGAELGTIGAIGYTSVFGLSFDRNGDLYGTAAEGSAEGRLLKIDLDTGQGMPVVGTRRPMFGLAIQPCPPPCVPPSTRHTVAPNPGLPTLADLNGDARLDIVTLSAVSSTLSVLLNRGDGSFGEAAQNLPVLFGGQIAGGDVNGDGFDDVIGLSPRVLHVLLSKGDGSFQSDRTISLTYAPVYLHLADVNSDGRLDAVVGGGNIQVMLGDGAGGFSAGNVLPAPDGLQNFALGDLNGDHKPDLARYGRLMDPNAGLGLDVFRGNGSGQFLYERHVLVDAASNGRPLIVDLTKDGKGDLVLSDFTFKKVHVLLGNGNLDFQQPGSVEPVGRPSWVDVGDLYGDGSPDLVTRESSPNAVVTYLNQGSGTFGPGSALPLNGSIAVGDLNGDHRAEVVVASPGAAAATDPGSITIVSFRR